MVAPSRTPPDVLATISVAVQAIWREGLGEAVRERGLDPLGYDAPAAKAFIAAEQAKWLAIAAEAGVQPE
jgi:tripartite-type tricarboxylate transporter receptor subunit TctC